MKTKPTRDEFIVALYQKIAGPFSGLVACPPLVASAIRRLQQKEHEEHISRQLYPIQRKAEK